jgi:hypothetical protein
MESNLQDEEEFKEALTKNPSLIKRSLLQRWKKSDNPALRAAAKRLTENN